MREWLLSIGLLDHVVEQLFISANERQIPRQDACASIVARLRGIADKLEAPAVEAEAA